MFLSSERDTTEVGAQWFFALSAVNRDFEALHGPVGGMHRGAVGVQHGAPAIATSFGFESYGKKRLQVVRRYLHGTGVYPWHDLWARHQTAHRSGHHATKVGDHGFVASLPASGAARAPSTCSVRSCCGKSQPGTTQPMPQQPHCAWLGHPPHAGVSGTQMTGTSACWQSHSRHGSSRDSSRVTG